MATNEPKDDPKREAHDQADDVRPGTSRRRVRRVLLEWIDADDNALGDLPAPLVEAWRKFAPNVQIREVRNETELPWTELRFLAVDTETTGLKRESDRIMEIAWVLFERGEVKERFSQLLKVGAPLPARITEITGIYDEMLARQPTFSSIADSLLLAFESVDFVVAYHVPFDRGFIAEELRRCEKSLPNTPWVDPLIFIKEVDRYKPGKKLSDVSARWGVAHGRPHRALDDACATGQLLLKVGPYLPMRTLDDVLAQQENFRTRQRNEADPMRRSDGSRSGSAKSAAVKRANKDVRNIQQSNKEFLFGSDPDPAT